LRNANFLWKLLLCRHHHETDQKPLDRPLEALWPEMYHHGQNQADPDMQRIHVLDQMTMVSNDFKKFLLQLVLAAVAHVKNSLLPVEWKLITRLLQPWEARLIRFDSRFVLMENDYLTRDVPSISSINLLVS